MGGRRRDRRLDSTHSQSVLQSSPPYAAAVAGGQPTPRYRRSRLANPWSCDVEVTPPPPFSRGLVVTPPPPLPNIPSTDMPSSRYSPWSSVVAGHQPEPEPVVTSAPSGVTDAYDVCPWEDLDYMSGAAERQYAEPSLSAIFDVSDTPMSADRESVETARLMAETFSDSRRLRRAVVSAVNDCDVDVNLVSNPLLAFSSHPFEWNMFRGCSSSSPHATGGDNGGYHHRGNSSSGSRPLSGSAFSTAGPALTPREDPSNNNDDVVNHVSIRSSAVQRPSSPSPSSSSSSSGDGGDTSTDTCTAAATNFMGGASSRRDLDDLSANRRGESGSSRHNNSRTSGGQTSVRNSTTTTATATMSNSNTAETALHSVFRCYICLETLQDARLCPHCSKMCCYSCIRKWLIEQRSQCPHCRAPLYIDELVKCRWVEEVTQQLSSLRVVVSPGERKSDGNAHSLTDDHCKDHSDEIISVFCETCSSCICHRCALWNGSHKSHTFKPLNEVFNERRGELSEQVNILKRRLVQHMSVVQEVDCEIEMVRGVKDDRQEDLRRTMEGMFNRLNEQLQDKLEILDERREKAQSDVDSVEELLDTIEYIVNMADPESSSTNDRAAAPCHTRDSRRINGHRDVLNWKKKSTVVDQFPELMKSARSLIEKTNSSSSTTHSSSGHDASSAYSRRLTHFTSEITPDFSDTGVFVIKNFSSSYSSKPSNATQNTVDYHKDSQQQQFVSLHTYPLETLDGLIWRLKVYGGHHIKSSRRQYLSVFLELVSSDEQDDLSTPTVGRYEYRIEMINHESSNIVRQFASDFKVGDCWGYKEFYRMDALQHEGFIRPSDGALIIHFQVKPQTYYQKCVDQSRYIRKLLHDLKSRGSDSSTSSSKEEASSSHSTINLLDGEVEGEEEEEENHPLHSHYRPNPNVAVDNIRDEGDGCFARQMTATSEFNGDVVGQNEGEYDDDENEPETVISHNPVESIDVNDDSLDDIARVVSNYSDTRTDTSRNISDGMVRGGGGDSSLLSREEINGVKHVSDVNPGVASSGLKTLLDFVSLSAAAQHSPTSSKPRSTNMSQQCVKSSKDKKRSKRHSLTKRHTTVSATASSSLLLDANTSPSSISSLPSILNTNHPAILPPRDVSSVDDDVIQPVLTTPSHLSWLSSPLISKSGIAAKRTEGRDTSANFGIADDNEDRLSAYFASTCVVKGKEAPTTTSGTLNPKRGVSFNPERGMKLRNSTNQRHLMKSTLLDGKQTTAAANKNGECRSLDGQDRSGVAPVKNSQDPTSSSCSSLTNCILSSNSRSGVDSSRVDNSEEKATTSCNPEPID